MKTHKAILLITHEEDIGAASRRRLHFKEIFRPVVQCAKP